MDDLLGVGEDVNGEDDVLGDDLLGSIEAALMGAGALSRRRGHLVGRMKAPGVNAPASKRYPLGFTTVTFVNGGATTGTATATPMKPFRGERLVIERFNVGAASPGLATTLTAFLVGADAQIPSAQPIGTGAFAPTAFGVTGDYDPAVPGIIITLAYAISAAPAAAETVTLVATLFGRAYA